MAFVVYIGFFANNSNTVSNDVQKKTTEVKKEVTTKATAKANDDIIQNPMVKVSDGKRAISLKTVLEAGVSGYIEANSKVDVIAFETTIDAATNKKFKSSVLILQDIKVLAVGKSSDTPQEALDYQTVTLEVTPDQGLTLSLASKDKDGFYFMLRNTKDKGKIEEMKRSTREVIEEGNGD